MSLSETTTLERARDLVADLVPEDIAEATPEEDLRDYGLDSVRLMALVDRITDAGGHLVYTDVLGGTTLTTIARALETTGAPEGAA